MRNKKTNYTYGVKIPINVARTPSTYKDSNKWNQTYVAGSPSDSLRTILGGSNTSRIRENKIDKMLPMNVRRLGHEGSHQSHLCQVKTELFDYALTTTKNAITIHNSYAIPEMGKGIDSVGDGTGFSTFVAIYGYWKAEIDGEDQDRTEFSSHHGLYRFFV